MVDPHFPPELWLPDPPLSDPLHFSGIKVNAKARAKNPESLISVIGLVHSEKEVEVRSIVRLQTFGNLGGGKESEYAIELVDTDGKVLSAAQLYQIPSSGYCGSCHNSKDNPLRHPYVFQAFLEDVAAGALIRISQHEKEIWVRPAPAKPVRIQSFIASMSKKKSAVIVKWKASYEQESEVWLQWSEDKGQTWHGLATRLMGKRAELDISILPPGQIQLRMLVNDGFYTATSDPVSINIPSRSPLAIILHPSPNSRILINNTMRLHGKPVDVKSATWLTDNKQVGIGFDIFVTAPSKGTHQCTLRAIVNRKTIEQVVEFKVMSVS